MSSAAFRSYINKEAGINTYTGDYDIGGNIFVEGNGSIVRGTANLSPVSSTDIFGNLFGGRVTVSGNVSGGLLIGNGALITGTGEASIPSTIVSDISGNLTGTFASMSGNITANYFIGNGAGLVGIIASVPTRGNIDINGNIFSTGNVDASNVSVALLRVNGNATVSGQVNASMLVANYYIGNGSYITGIAETTIPTRANLDITGNVTSTANVDAVSNMVANTLNVGNITIGANISASNIVSAGYFIGNGSQLSSLIPNTIRTNIIGNVTASGNVTTSAYLIGNAYNMYFSGNLVTLLANVADAPARLALTNVPLGGMTTQTDVNSQFLLAYQPPSVDSNWVALTNTNFPVTSAFGRIGDVVLTSGVDIKTLGGASIVGAGDISSANIDVIGNVTGNATTRVLNSGNANIQTISATGQVKVEGNIFASVNFIGNGIFLTGTPGTVPATGDVDIIGNVRAPGNVDGVYLAADRTRVRNANVFGQVNATGNVVGSLVTFLFGDGTNLTDVTIGPSSGVKRTNINGNVSATGNADAANISANLVRVNGSAFVTGFISTPQTFTANLFFGNGALITGITTVTGNQRADITGNVSAPGNVVCANATANILRVNGNITVGNVFSSTGNITAAFFVGNGSQITDVLASGTQLIDVVGNVTAAANVDAANVSTTWLIVNGNANVTGQVNVEGNIVVLGTFFGNGALISAVVPTNLSGTQNTNITGNVVAPGNVDAANISTGNVMVHQNVEVLGNIIVTGNVTAQSPSIFIGNGSGLTNLTVSGNQNFNITGNVDAPGNVVASNLSVGSMRVNSNVINTGDVNVTGNVIANYLIGNGSQLTGVVASAGFVASFITPNTGFSSNTVGAVTYANAWSIVLNSTQPRFITVRTPTLPPNSSAPFTTVPAGVTQTLSNAWTFSFGIWTGIVRLQASSTFTAASNNLVMNYHTSFGLYNGLSSETLCSAV